MGPNRGVRLVLCGWLIAAAPTLKSDGPVPVTRAVLLFPF